ncbi:thioesterase II family protein [Aquimarina sediminis]|uniref:thioesterase II family protein n=1 Tax=Aquimarina sediminis TaxID=2070536 RepID=UPI000CA02C42|nr:thioesterase domain-containing protein [Aquimarina sediminis]
MTKKIKLFCLPYAGGSASIYTKWKPRLAKNIELCPVELAGRGRRISDSFYTNLNEAVENIYDLIKDDILEYDYAFYGHSMGALLTYEFLQKVALLGLKPPIHAFFSGRNAPHTARTRRKYSSMSPSEFEEEILALGGTPPEFFAYPELRELFIPLLRSDFSIAETIVDRPNITPLKSNISVLIGKNEDISPDQVNGWKLHTDKKCSIYYIKGGHFFLQDQKDTIVDIINTTLS